MVDTLSDTLNSIYVSETKGRDTMLVKIASKMIKRILEIFKEEGYVENYEIIDDKLSGKASVKLAGKINKCKAIKPRFSIKNDEWEKWESRYLPAKDIGVIIVSTSRGVMTHNKAKELGVGGRLIAFVY